MLKITSSPDIFSLQLKEIERIYRLFLTLEKELNRINEAESKHLVEVGRTSFEESLFKTPFFNQLHIKM